MRSRAATVAPTAALLAALIATGLGTPSRVVTADSTAAVGAAQRETVPAPSPPEATTLPPDLAAFPRPLPFPPARANEPVIVVGRIEIPRLGVSALLYEGASLNTLDRGPAHVPGTAMAGQIGTMVIGGHRTAHDHPFGEIDTLVPGDEMTITTDAGVFRYRMSGSAIVEPHDLAAIASGPTARAALFACHPKGSTAQRYLAFFDLVGGA